MRSNQAAPVHRCLRLALAALPLAAAASAQASTFPTFDPVTMALGGTGVGLAHPTAGMLHNPATLSALPESTGLTFATSASARAFDQDELVDAVDEFQDQEYVTTLDNSLRQTEQALADFAASGSSSDRDQAVAGLRASAEDTRDLNGGLQSVTGSPLEAEFAGALAASRPSRSFGVGLSFSAWGTGSATTRYEDTFLDTVASDLDVCADALANNNPCDPNNLTFIADSDGDGEPDTISLDPETELDSAVLVRGLLVSEIGLTLSRAFEIGGRTVALGVTPKAQTIEVFDYEAAVDDADADQIDSEQTREEFDDFNFDVGAHTTFGPIGVGLTVRNVIGNEYETALGNKVEVSPQARAGVSYGQDWYRLGADLDLTTNESPGFADDSQFLSAGGEIDLAGWLQLRGGYRVNLAGSARDVASVGLGLAPFRVFHIDLALAGNDNEVGFAGNLSLTF